MDEPDLHAFHAHCAEWFEARGVSALNVNFDRLISPAQFRNAFIRQEYFNSCPAKKYAICFKIAKDKGMTVSMVMKIVEWKR